MQVELATIVGQRENVDETLQDINYFVFTMSEQLLGFWMKTINKRGVKQAYYKSASVSLDLIAFSKSEPDNFALFQTC